jgi:hypothetical protein
MKKLLLLFTILSCQVFGQTTTKYDCEFFVWDGSIWNNNWRTTNTINSDENIIEKFTEHWDGINTTLSNAVRFTYTYDGNESLTEELLERWNIYWEPNRRDTYAYDSIGNRTSWLWESWNLGVWKNVLYHQYAYDSTGNVTIKIMQNWDGSAWENAGRDTYYYDGSGYLIQILEELWSFSYWDSASTITYLYDSNGNRIGELEVNSHKYTYTYDTNNNQTEWLVEVWDAPQSNSWRVNQVHTYTYDGNSNQIEWLKEVWDNSIPGLILFEREIYSYDVNGTQTELLEQQHDFISSWINYKKYYFDTDTNCSQPLTPIETISPSNQLSVYPNPANNNITISVKGDFVIINVLGQTVYAGSQKVVDVSGWNKGVYYLKALNNTKQIVKF